ncbi:hypothetical protein [Planctomicrobium sp. SH527]|uniref:hypothetical protein n=1 Tax=Planctomicrobium sp. SH527 TaxID=3448123 RepID=UPI003F5C8580
MVPSTGESINKRAVLEISEREMPPVESEYLSLLSRILADRRLTLEEKEEAERFCDESGLSRADRKRIHQDCLRYFVMVALAEGELQESHKSELNHIAKLLGLKPESVPLAIESAQAETLRVTELISQFSSESKQENRTRSLSLSSAWKVAAGTGNQIVGAVGFGIGTAAKVTKLLASRHDIHCQNCGQILPHALKVENSFPLKAWLMLAWQARTLSAPGFLMNAAVMAASDKQLLSQTGKSLLPKFCCSKCNAQCDHWEAARVLLKAIGSVPQKTLSHTPQDGT